MSDKYKGMDEEEFASHIREAERPVVAELLKVVRDKSNSDILLALTAANTFFVTLLTAFCLETGKDRAEFALALKNFTEDALDTWDVTAHHVLESDIKH